MSKGWQARGRSGRMEQRSHPIGSPEAPCIVFESPAVAAGHSPDVARLLQGLNPAQRAAVAAGRGADPDHRRPRQRQDARDHPPHRLPDRSSRRRRPTASWPSPSPTRPPRRCASASTRCCGADAARTDGRHVPRAPAPACCARTASSSGSTADFTIYDDDDQLDLVKRALQRPGPRREAVHAPRAVLLAISARQERAARRRTVRSAAPRATSQEIVARGLHALPGAARARTTRSTSTTCSLDAVRAVRAAPERAASSTRTASSYLLVDEFQDTNLVQYSMVQAARRRSTATSASSATRTSRSTAGARPTSATSSTSSATFPTPKIVLLEQNYRSTQTILDVAQRRDQPNDRAQGEEPLDREPGAASR